MHRLVAFTFIPNPKNKRTINHKDGNRLNNCVDNLEWATYKENNNHAFDTGLMTTNKKIKLINKKTREVLRFRSMQKTCEYLGYYRGYISNKIKKGKFENKKYKWELI